MSFERDRWIEQFETLLYDWYADLDPADFEDDMDRIERQQEANRLVDLLEAYDAGEIGYEQFMAEYNTGYLFDEIPGFDDWLKESRDAVQYDSMYKDWEIVSKSDDPQAIQDFVSLYNRTGILDNSLVQADLASTGSATAVITGTIDNSILEDMIRKAAIGDGILGGEVDFEDLPGYGGIWEGLIRHIKVIGKGLPLPIPDWLPLPGIFELPTIGEIFDTVTGPWKTAAEDALRDCVDTGKSASQCLEEQSVIDILVDGIGTATSDIYDATASKVQDILDETIDCASNPGTCAQEVFDKLKDIFGDGAVDPTSTGGNIPDWMKVIIIGGTYGDEILGELEDLFGGDIDDNGTIGVGPEEPQPFDCATVGKFNPDGGAASEADCVDPCQYDSNIPSTSPECQDPAPNGYCEDGTTPKDNPQGTNCEEYEPPLTPEEQQCDEQGRVFNDITGECEETCANPEHVVGPDGNCGPPEVEQTCNNGAVDPGTCSECEDGSTPDQHQGGNCNNPLIDPSDPFNCAAGRPEGGYSFATQTWDRNCSADYCYNGTPKQTVDGVYGANCEEYVAPQPQEGDPCDSNGDGQNDGTIVNGECVPTTTTGEDCPNGAENYPDCDQCPQGQSLVDGQCTAITTTGEDCPNGATNFPDCDQCPTGQSLVDGQCAGITTPECDQQDRVTNADGSCGECKPGFTPDPEGFDQCIQAPLECNDCSCEQYAADNPVECGTDTEEPGPDGGDAGGGGGGGGGGMFTGAAPVDLSFDIAGDPTLLARSEFPITDFLAGIFTNSRGGRNV